MATCAANRHSVSPHEVLVRLLLHLPRDADADAEVESRIADAESERVAADLASATAAYSSWQELPASGEPKVGDLRLTGVSEATARAVLERFHYLSSFRPSSEHLGGLVHDGREDRLVALLSISGLDVPTIAEQPPADVAPEDIAVLSRVFAFDWAPHNTLSFLLARASRTLRRRAGAPRLLLTYLNPNLGFTGASYRAANWVLWGREVGTRYAYLDGRYTTDRELQRCFGSADPTTLTARLGSRFASSRMALQPLDLYVYPLDPSLRGRLGVGAPIELPRPGS